MGHENRPERARPRADNRGRVHLAVGIIRDQLLRRGAQLRCEINLAGDQVNLLVELLLRIDDAIGAEAHDQFPVLASRAIIR